MTKNICLSWFNCILCITSKMKEIQLGNLNLISNYTHQIAESLLDK